MNWKGVVIVLMSQLLVTTEVIAFSVENRVFVSTPAKAEVRNVGDCMTPHPLCLRSTDAVDAAIQNLLQTGHNGAPVVDGKTNALVGMVSAFDFLKKEEAGALLPMQGTPNELTQTMQAARQICGNTVGDLMSPIDLTVSPSTTMKEAAEIMTRDRCHRLCVVDEAGQLVGVLSTSDVMGDVLTRVRQALPECPVDALSP